MFGARRPEDRLEVYDGNRLRGGSLLHGHRHQSGLSDIFFKKNQGISLTSKWRFPCKRREV